MSDSVGPRYPILSLEKAIQVILYIHNNSDSNGVSLSEISKNLKISKSTTHRILDTLLCYSFVEKTNDSLAKYRLGWGLYNAGYNIPALHPLEASNFKDRIIALSEKINMPASLHIISDNHSIPIFCASDNINSNHILFKKHFPLYASATGKLFLENYSEEDLIKYFHNTDIRKYTSNTILNFIDFLDELSFITEHGYALDNGEYDKNEYNIAMPVKNYAKKTVAAININLNAPIQINSNSDIYMSLKECCSSISSFMGYDE
mgnify:CR=1 FL=1